METPYPLKHAEMSVHGVQSVSIDPFTQYENGGWQVLTLHVAGGPDRDYTVNIVLFADHPVLEPTPPAYVWQPPEAEAEAEAEQEATL